MDARPNQKYDACANSLILSKQPAWLGSQESHSNTKGEKQLVLTGGGPFAETARCLKALPKSSAAACPEARSKCQGHPPRIRDVGAPMLPQTCARIDTTASWRVMKTSFGLCRLTRLQLISREHEEVDERVRQNMLYSTLAQADVLHPAIVPVVLGRPIPRRPSL